MNSICLIGKEGLYRGETPAKILPLLTPTFPSIRKGGKLTSNVKRATLSDKLNQTNLNLFFTNERTDGLSD